MTNFSFSRLRFLFAPRVSANDVARTAASTIREAERRKARSRCRGSRDKRSAACVAQIAARAPFGRRARLSALYRGSRQDLRLWLSPVPRFMAAPTDLTPSATRAASSWQTGVVAGRASFRTACAQSVWLRPQEPPSLPFGEYPRPKGPSHTVSEVDGLYHIRGRGQGKGYNLVLNPAEIIFPFAAYFAENIEIHRQNPHNRRKAKREMPTYIHKLPDGPVFAGPQGFRQGPE